MSSPKGGAPLSRLGRIVNSFEENAIAILLGVMTLVTFVNVVLRYVFGSMLIWGLEVVLILFAWLVILGVSYCVKVTAHLGVDALTNLFPPNGRRALAIFAGLICILYTVLMLKGAWDYWAPYAALERTSGRWFPTGFEKTRDQAFYVTDQVPMLPVFSWLEGAINQGEAYEKLPRVVPYFILPFGVALLLFRFIQATIGLIRGNRSTLIVSHEAEDAVDEVAAMNRED